MMHCRRLCAKFVTAARPGRAGRSVQSGCLGGNVVVETLAIAATMMQAKIVEHLGPSISKLR